MKAKQFLVQLQYDPSSTRWLANDANFCELLYHLASSAVECHTAGSCPAVMVTTNGKEAEPLTREQMANWITKP